MHDLVQTMSKGRAGFVTVKCLANPPKFVSRGRRLIPLITTSSAWAKEGTPSGLKKEGAGAVYIAKAQTTTALFELVGRAFEAVTRSADPSRRECRLLLEEWIAKECALLYPEKE